MLDLLGFKKEFVSLCRSALCESGPVDMEIEERKVNKAQRGELNGLLFKKEGLNCAPTFYVEDFYMAYKDGTSIADLSHQAVETAVRSLDMADLLARDSFCMLDDTESLRVRMLNKSRNKEYLKGIPFRELGCGFVYIAEIGRGEYGAVITDALMKDHKLTGDEIFDKAIKNTMENYPAVLHDLGDSVMQGTEECENLLEKPSGRVPAGAGPGFVLTNSGFFWGAGTLFYPGIMDRICELLGGDFYVLPSSVHELILIKVEDQDPQELADLVRSANRSVVRENEILADDLYICESGKLCRVSYGGMIPACGDNVC
ncbi:MAG: hypothetical protein IJJ03_10145 [Mogibacterium sp.]|nr:hypothetical protein [Mogibacterium sp.]MBQ6501793.1 hypothetical protein [Mogibacterium sp.]